MDNIKLLGSRVLIDTGDTESKTDSGLIVSRSNNPDDIQSGVVISVGGGSISDGIWQDVKGVDVGDTVMFHYGTKLELDGKHYMLVNESDIILVKK